MYSNVPETLTFDGVEHKLADLSKKTQSLVFVYTKWQNELVDARLEVDKVTAALREAEAQLTASVKEDLAPKEPAAANDETAAPAAE